MDWIGEARRVELNVPGFTFSDGSLMDVRLTGRTLGNIANAATHTVMLLHGTIGSSEQYLEPEFADILFGPGKSLDIDRHFVVLPDALGHGGSSKPSDTPDERFPRYGYHDMVSAQHHFVTTALGISHLRLVMGASHGWHADMDVGRPFPRHDGRPSCDSQRARAHIGPKLAVQTIAHRARSRRFGGGGAERQGGKGLTAAWVLFHLMAGSPAGLEQELPDIDAADDFIREMSDKIRAQHPLDVIAEFDASWDYDPATLLQRIVAPLLAINFADDAINPTELGGITKAIANVRLGRAVTLPASPGSLGHQNLRQPERWADWVRSFLQTKTPQAI